MMRIGSQVVVLFLGAFLVPLILIFFSFLIRNVKGWYYTAGSDILFFLMTFSFTSSVLWKDMSQYVRNPDLRTFLYAVFLVVGLIIMLCWYWTVSRVEVLINDAIRKRTKPQAIPQGKIYLAWSFVVMFFGLEILIFLFP